MYLRSADGMAYGIDDNSNNTESLTGSVGMASSSSTDMATSLHSAVLSNLTLNLSLMQGSEVEAIRLGSILSIYILPCIVFSGFILNTISCLVFTSQELRQFSSSVYIFAVLISDTGVLIGLLFVWLEAIGYRVNHLNGMCQGLVFFTYIFSFLSVWYVVCITVENYITICHPMKFNVMCTRRRASIVVLSILLLSVLMYGVTAFAAQVTHHPYTGDDQCILRPELMPLMRVLTYIDSMVTLLIPLIAISGMLITLVLSILHKSRWKKRLSSLPLLDLSQAGASGVEHRRSVSRPNAQVRVAKMLFALSVSYIIMFAPSHVTRLYYLIRPRELGMHDLTYSEGLLQLIFQYLTYSNHAGKFWIFVIYSQNFMKGLKAVLTDIVRCRSLLR